MYIIAHTCKTENMQAYHPNYEFKDIPIVDTALQYDNPYDEIAYILVIRNALHVPSIYNHVIPYFLMRESVITVKHIPKIHLDDTNVSDHSIRLD